MQHLIENNLRLTLPHGISGRKFDDNATHGLAHCMKAVDFVIQFPKKTIFIEFKDPDDPAAAAFNNRDEFLKRFSSGSIDCDLIIKYRDSFLYEWASGNIDNKNPIYYYVLIAASSLTKAELIVRTDALKRRLPVDGPGNKPWRSIVSGCAVMNIETWNEVLKTLPINRV